VIFHEQVLGFVESSHSTYSSFGGEGIIPHLPQAPENIEEGDP
jgi:hypothetical protein